MDYLQEGQGSETVISVNSISDLENPAAFIATSILLYVSGLDIAMVNMGPSSFVFSTGNSLPVTS